MGKYGTLSMLEDLAADNDPVAGREEYIAQRFREALDAHNANFREMVGILAETTNQAQMPYGGADEAIIVELDEYGAADASKVEAFGNLGLPLRNFGGTVQWTSLWFEMHSAADMAKQLDAFATRDIRMFQEQIRRTYFRPTNTVGYFDKRQTKLTYDLKALLNADGQAIPTAPNGKTFDGATHTHYLASATYDEAAVSQLLDTVVEHGIDGSLQLFIAREDEETVRGFTGFAPYLDRRVTVTGAAQVGSEALDTESVDNRAIGVWNGAEVWVKPWVPGGYASANDVGAAEKPIAIRTRTGDLTGPGAFRMVGEHEHFPLRAQHLAREYGVGVVGRHKAAVLYTGGTTYVEPATA